MADKQDSHSVSQSNASSSTVDQDVRRKVSDLHNCCFSVKPKGYEVFIQMGQACNGSASIYIGKHTPTGHFVAIRQVPLEDCHIDVQDLQHEINMHRVYNGEYILDYLSTFMSGSTLWIVMPLQGYGSCMDILQAHFTYGLPELVIALILKQVLKALVYLHGCGLIHRSLRSSHILLSETGQVQLSGLRNCHILDQHGVKKTRCWHYPTNSSKAIYYYSPQILMQDLNGYDEKSDIYSLGLVACELANGHTPFANLRPFEILYEKLDGNTPHLLDSQTCTPGMDEEYTAKTFSQEFHEFVEICCSQHPEARPSAEELLKHGFFKQTKKNTYEELPAMLQPLTPLTDSVLKNSANTGALAGLTHDLSTMSVTEDTWDFD